MSACPDIHLSGCPVHLSGCLHVRETHQLDLYIFPLYLCNRNSLAGFVHFLDVPMQEQLISWTCKFFRYARETHQLDLYIFFAVPMQQKLISQTFKHVHAFSFSNLNNLFILLDKEKVQLYYVGLPFRQKCKLFIHIFIVDHRSTSLPECGSVLFNVYDINNIIHIQMCVEGYYAVQMSNEGLP